MDTDESSDWNAVVEVVHVLVQEPNAPRRDRLPDGARLVRAMNAKQRVPLTLEQVERACPKRVVDPALHKVGQIRPTLEHLSGRRPRRPLGLALHLRRAGPGKPASAHPDAIAQSG